MSAHVHVHPALDYAKRGWAVFPVKPNGKIPLIADWPNQGTASVEQISTWWTSWPNANVGIVTGRKSGLVIIDIDARHDGEDSLKDLERKFGELPETVEVLTGGGGRHLYFQCPPNGAVIRNSAGTLGSGLDVRGEGGYVVAPPSRHESGQTYEWEMSSHPDDVDIAPLPDWLLTLLQSPTQPKNTIVNGQDSSKIPEGQRNARLTSLAGTMHRQSMSKEAMTAALHAENTQRCQPPLPENEVHQIVNSVSRYPSAAAHIEEVEEPIDLADPQLLAIPTDIFPGWVEDMVVAQAEATETPTDLGAVLMLGVLSTACQKKFEVAYPNGHREPLNIWAVSAMNSGERKTPVLKGLTNPLHEWQREQAKTLAPEIARMQSERETALARIKSLRTKAANASIEDFGDVSKEISGLESSLPTIPCLPRLWTQDITPERLGTLLAEQGERMSIISDEGGIFDLMGGRYSNGLPNLDVFLQSYSGSPVCVDRQGKDSIHLDTPALTMCLSPQPQVLRGLTEKPGFRGRGLLARFLYALPSSRLGYRTGNTRPIPTSISTRYTENIKSLLDELPAMDSEGTPYPKKLRFSDEAYQEWHEFFQAIEVDMREGGRLEHLRDWGGKLPGNTARIAGLLHCAQHVSAKPEGHDITADTIQRAICNSAILIHHALAAFDVMGADPNLEAARKVWAWVKRQRKKRFTARDCFQALKTPYPNMAMLTPAFEVLMERYYIFTNTPTGKKNGRPSLSFSVNPHLTGGWND